MLFSAAVTPGFSTDRIGGGLPWLNFERRGGEGYRVQWEALVENGIEPFLVNVTSFNEWHEGSNIEPSKDFSDPQIFLKTMRSELVAQGWVSP